jgi:vitamin K-dependent gamma-carboxylase
MSTQSANPVSARPRDLPGGALGAFLGRLFAPVDIASLVVFRIAFGAIMVWEVCRYFYYGWVGFYFVEPEFRFAYFGFDWIRPWPSEWMYAHFLVLGVLAAFIAVGFLYRLTMILFFLGFTYIFLFDQSLYLNHFYLICLISLIMIFVPAHRALSVDAWLRRSIRSDTVPAWTLWLLMTQIGIVYFYGGLAKLNGDWLRGEPMRMWLAGSTDFPVIGRFFTEEWAAYLFSYGGLLLDLLVVPFLLWRRSRPFAFATVVVFHVLNADLFRIGIFPWFMIAATLLFFPQSWPRSLAKHPRAPGDASRSTGDSTVVRLGPKQYIIVGLLGLYLAIQLLVPLRHHLYPGNVSWTEEGHRFSWHMKLRDKQATARFVAVDPTSGAVEMIRPRGYGLTSEQTSDMFGKPDMVLQFAHHVAGELRERGREDVEVRALIAASLNGRDPQLLIDPTVDLAAQRGTLVPAEWILPLEEPLSAGERALVHRPRPAEFRSELRRAADETGWEQLFRPGNRRAESSR